MLPLDLTLVWVSLLVLSLQGLLMVFDEFVFHWRRGLPVWERIGHPLDTLTVIACFCFAFLNEFSTANLAVFAGLGVFSCVFVTKDEFVHSRECDPAEQWLHAALFVMHPLVIGCYGMIWWLESELPKSSLVPFLGSTVSVNLSISKIMLGQILITGFFCLYQIIYWNVIRKNPVSQ